MMKFWSFNYNKENEFECSKYEDSYSVMPQTRTQSRLDNSGKSEKILE